MAVTIRKLLPLIKWNDVRIVNGEEEEICLIRKDYIDNIFSEKFLDIEVNYIDNDESILDTINIHIKKEEN